MSVLADGKFHQTVPVGTEGAVLREGEDKDGVPFSKWELVFDAVSGIISSVQFHEGKFGKSLNVVIDGVTVSFSTNGKFGEDLMKKILLVDTSKSVRLVPYSFLDEKGRNQSGVTVYQDDKKVPSYFHDYDTGTKKMTPKNGYPEMPVAKAGKKISPDEWKMFFMQARLFMIDKIEERFGNENARYEETPEATLDKTFEDFGADVDDTPF